VPRTSSYLRYLESKAPRGDPERPPAAFLFTNVKQEGLESAVVALVARLVWSAEIDCLVDWRRIRETAIRETEDLYDDIQESLGSILKLSGEDSFLRDKRHASYHWEHSSYLIGQLFDLLESNLPRKVRFPQFIDVATQSLQGSLLEGGLAQAKNGYTFRGVIAEPTLVTTLQEVDGEFLKFLASHPHVVDRISWQAFERIALEIFSGFGFEVHHVGTQWGGSADLLLINRDIEGRKQSCIVECKRYRKNRKVGLDVVNSVLGARLRAGADSAMLVTTGMFSNHVENEREKLKTLKLKLRDGAQLVEWLQAQYGKQKTSLDQQPQHPEEVWLPLGWDRKK